jgi:copper chaperone CopZ
LSQKQWGQRLASNPDDAQLNELHVGGMHCSNCAGAVERQLKASPQVRHVKVDYPAGRAVVRHTGEPGIADLQEAVADEGYTVAIAGPICPPGSRHREEVS